jgi:hypothetical protein
MILPRFIRLLLNVMVTLAVTTGVLAAWPMTNRANADVAQTALGRVPATAAGASSAAPAGSWTPCNQYTWKNSKTWLVAHRQTKDQVGGYERWDNGSPYQMGATIKQNFSETVSVEISGGFSSELTVTDVLKFSSDINVKAQQSITISREAGVTVGQIPPGGWAEYRQYVHRLHMWIARIDYSEKFREIGMFPGEWCRDKTRVSTYYTKSPLGQINCLSGPGQAAGCGYGSGGGGGQPPGGGTSPAPPGPTPVTDVRGLADGTLLLAKDTGRVYKMVGGAPVWQATCADGICGTAPRPTTQAVINAGPAIPRDGSSAIDQRGHIYIFVGGSPLHQESCAAPVSCGSPVKVSDWSIDARDHMNDKVADGSLVQAKAGDTDLPVSVTVGRSLVPFASPQEVIDAGYGANWRERVVAITANSYNKIGFMPVDGTLIQGAAGGTSTPVGMITGGAVIPFANPQEVIDAGFGTDWASKVRGVPARYFNALPGTPHDGTLIQGSNGATPVAAIVGTARVNFASPQEVIDAGFGTDWGSKVRAVPARFFNALPTQIFDGTRIAKAGSTSEGAIVGGANVPFHSMAELTASGYGDRPRQVIPARVWDGLPTQIADGTRIKDADSPSQAAIVGGAKIPFISMDELTQTGYADKPMRVVPGRVWNALPTQIADGTRIAKTGATSEAAIVGRARIDFHTMAELQAAGYGGKLRQVIPARVWDGLTTDIADGTYVKSPDSAAVWLVNGGRRTPASQSRGVQVIPTRVLDAIPAA